MSKYLLWHASTSGQIGMPAKIGHTNRGPRIYTHDGHFIVVDGHGWDAYEDVEAILKIPGYRLATSEEQKEYYSQFEQEEDETVAKRKVGRPRKDAQ